MRAVVWVAVAVLAGCSGCAAQRVHRDQNQIRDVLLDLYTDKLIDNLIRAYNGQPFIQVDYANLGSTVTFTGNGGVNGGEDINHSKVTNLPTMAKSITDSIRSSVNWSGSVNRQNQVTM